MELDIDSYGLVGVIRAIQWYGFKRWCKLSYKIHRLATGRDIFEQPLMFTYKSFLEK